MKASILVVGGVVMSLVSHPALAAGLSSAPNSPEANVGASDDAPHVSSDGEDIIVTARKREESLQGVPLAVTAITGEGLNRASVRELRDLSAVVPNLAIASSNLDPSAVVFTIRGQSQTNSALLSIDNAVGVYFEGVNSPRNTGLRAGLVDIQRVEVLRGPQGTLYGRNTTGGAVSIVYRDPTEDLGGSIQAGVGTYGAWNLLGVLNVPLSQDFGVRLVAQHSEHGPYGRKTLTGDGVGAGETTYFRAKAKFDNGVFSMGVTGEYWRYDNSGMLIKLAGLVPATATTPAGGPALNEVARVMFGLAPTATPTLAQRTAASDELAKYVLAGRYYKDIYANAPLDTTSKGHNITVNLQYIFSDFLSIQSISGYRFFEKSSRQDTDGTPYALLQNNSTTPYDKFYSQEVQFLGGNDIVNFVVGGYYSYENGQDLNFSTANAYSSNGNVTTTDALVTNSSIAAFAQGTWKFADKWSATLGARWTRETKKIVNRNRTSAGCGVPAALQDTPGVCAATFNNSYSDPSWLASLEYKANPDLLVYAKVSHAFRGGAQQERAISPPGSTPILASFQPVAPEKLTEYELGLKGDFFDRRLRFNVAAFYDDFTDVQRQATIAVVSGTGVVSNPSLLTNAASARLWGIEAEANLQLSENIRLRGTLGYLNAKYSRFVDAILGDRSGEDWPSPSLTYQIGATVTQPTAVGALTFDIAFNGQSKWNLSPSGRLRDQTTQSPYGLLNARISLDIDAWDAQVAIFGRNLTNTHYASAGVGVESLGFNSYLLGEPRVLGIQLTKKFGR